MRILLKTKSQVKIELSKYMARLQMQYNITIQGFRLDNKGTYIDQELKAWVSNKKIYWEFKVPYNPH